MNNTHMVFANSVSEYTRNHFSQIYDIKRFERILKRQPKVVVTEFSELYRNKGTKKHCGVKDNVQKKQRDLG